MKIADYLRRQGFFIEQLKEWRAISIKAHEMKLTENRRANQELRDIRNRLCELEKELARKDKAQVEAAVLLILREKFNALRNNSDGG
ncbi:transposase [Salmonella enterica]